MTDPGVLFLPGPPPGGLPGIVAYVASQSELPLSPERVLRDPLGREAPLKDGVIGIVALGTSHQESCQINKFCRENGLAFFWLRQTGSLVSLFCDSGSESCAKNPRGFCRTDNRALFIDQLNQNGDTWVLTTQIPHGLNSGDVVQVDGCPDLPVDLLESDLLVEVVSETSFYAARTGTRKVFEDGVGMPGHVKLVSQVDSKSMHFFPLSDPFEASLCHSDECTKSHHIAFMHQAGGIADEDVSAFAERFRITCCDTSVSPKSLEAAVGLTKEPANPTSYLDIGLAIVAEQIRNLATRRFSPICQWMHLSFPSASEKIDRLNLHDKDILINGLSPLSLSLYMDLVRLKDDLGFRKVLFCQGSNEEVITKDHQKVLDGGQLWQPVAQALQGRLKTDVDFIKHDMSGENEKTVYNANFFNNVGIIICPGGSYEERRFVGGLSVAHKIPLIDCGCANYMGHVESIIPHVTDCRDSVNDPSEENEVPFCILKSFPHNSDHCVLWAAEKAKRLLKEKPKKFNSFFTDNSVEEVLDFIKRDDLPDGSVVVYKMLRDECQTWFDCVQFARIKFEKYFMHKAQRLLHHFPPDAKTNAGNFWAHPKKIPNLNVKFNASDQTHFQFVRTLALCWASIWKVQVSEEDVSDQRIFEILNQITPEPFSVGNKKVVTDESLTRDEMNQDESDQQQLNPDTFQQRIQNAKVTNLNLDISEESLTNLVTCLSKLRCSMYNVPLDPDSIMTVANNSQTCGVETVHLVTKLVSLELRRLTSGEFPQNWWLSFIDSPNLIRSKSARCLSKQLGNLNFTLWDQFDVQSQRDWTLQDFLLHVESKLGIEVGMVIQGARMIYVHFMPGHKSRLTQLMSQHVKYDPGESCAVLTVTTKSDNTDETVPPIRYFAASS